MLGCAVALVILRRPRRELIWLVALPLLLLLPAAPAPDTGNQHALLVQPNIDTEMEWTTTSLARVERELAILSHSTAGHLIIWPEVPAPFYPSDAAFRAYVEGIARSEQAYFLFGGVAYNSDRRAAEFGVSVRSCGPDDGPLRQNQPGALRGVCPECFLLGESGHEGSRRFRAGQPRLSNFQVNGHKLGAFICYESAFPDLVRQFARGGAQVLVNMSNDGYFGHTSAREQHLELVRMRAAENRRWILRATNDGITADGRSRRARGVSRSAVSGTGRQRQLSVSFECHAVYSLGRLVRVGMLDCGWDFLAVNKRE